MNIYKLEKTPIYLKQAWYVSGPIWIHVNGKPINEDKYLMKEIAAMDEKKFNQYFTLSKKEALFAYREELKKRIQSYINVHLKHGLGSLDQIEREANSKYKKYVDRVNRKLKRYEAE
jgi:hypothetical protein